LARESKTGEQLFSLRLEQAVELIGSMRLKLWVSTSEGDDLPASEDLQETLPSFTIFDV
jgi:hypothetical protein